MESTCFGLFRAVLDSLGQFWTVKDGLNLVLDTVLLKPSFGPPKSNPVLATSTYERGFKVHCSLPGLRLTEIVK